MDAPDRAARLDARQARGVRRERRAPARPNRIRRLAAGALVAVLGVAVLALSRSGSASSASPPPVTAPPLTAPPVAASVDPTPLRALFAGHAGCADHGAEVPEVSCTVDGVRVDARLVGASEAGRAWAPSSPHAGPPECAGGKPDERSWSRPDAPEKVVGRYRCRVEHGRAEIWWTDDAGIVAHAVANDTDLARLFAWWLAHLTSR